MQIGGGCLAREIEIRGDDDLLRALPLDAGDQLSDFEAIRADPFHR